MNQPAKITGAVLVGAEERNHPTTFAAVDPATGATLAPPFSEAQAADVEAACELADAAFPEFNECAPAQRAQFLRCIASEITGLGDALLERAMAETGLPRGRLEGERTRTVTQLGFFADIVIEGSWIDATIDSALPQRALPRPDLRRRHCGVGPVAVFGASNFPLAFSVAGGDCASALAAGCPVIVKGHPAHPGTGELVARAVRAAVMKCGLPEGTFSYLPGSTRELGSVLVADPRIRAVGFTGSRQAGRALSQVAAARLEPIPVFAEMSSINPVVLFPQAARARGAELGRAYVASVTLGAGQFCTNPGVLFYLDGTDLAAFTQAAIQAMREWQAPPMLTAAIHENFTQALGGLTGVAAVSTLARSAQPAKGNRAAGAVLSAEATDFKADERLRQELFGPSSLLVRARDLKELTDVIDSMEGQLTGTLLFDEEDVGAVAAVIPHLERKVGRIIGNGWPTGVEVSHAMVHGGPYPATSDGHTSSVGALAIQRFLRPICYQGLPEKLLPPALQTQNPLRIPQRVDGTRSSLS